MNEKERQRNVVSTSATADLHTYFLRRSAIKFIFLLKRHKQAAATMEGIFSCRGRHGCSSCRSRPPLMVAAAAVVSANVSGVLSAPNLDHALQSPALILLASWNSGRFGSEGRPLLSTIAGGRLPPPSTSSLDPEPRRSHHGPPLHSGRRPRRALVPFSISPVVTGC